MIILAIFTFDRCLVSEFLKANFCPQCVQAYLVVVKMIKVLSKSPLLFKASTTLPTASSMAASIPSTSILSWLTLRSLNLVTYSVGTYIVLL